MNKEMVSFMTHSDDDKILSYSLRYPSYGLLVLCNYNISGAEVASYNMYCWSKAGPGFTWNQQVLIQKHQVLGKYHKKI